MWKGGKKIARGYILIHKASISKKYHYLANNSKFYIPEHRLMADKKYKRKLTKAIGQEPIEFFIKPIDSGYIGGEESSILNAIEGKKLNRVCGRRFQLRTDFGERLL